MNKLCKTKNWNYSFYTYTNICLCGCAGISLIADHQKCCALRMMEPLRVNNNQSNNAIFTLSHPIIPCMQHFRRSAIRLMYYKIIEIYNRLGLWHDIVNIDSNMNKHTWIFQKICNILQFFNILKCFCSSVQYIKVNTLYGS